MSRFQLFSVALALGCASGLASVAQSPSADQDKQFLTEASQGGYTEITFSQLALQRSSNPQVKAFAQKMVTDHQALEAQMKAFADKLGVTPATSMDSEHQSLYQQLGQMSGADFDKQYMSAMDKDHHKTLDAFKSEESSTQDAPLKATVRKGEKVVAQHTVMADKMVAKFGGPAAGSTGSGS